MARAHPGWNLWGSYGIQRRRQSSSIATYEDTSNVDAPTAACIHDEGIKAAVVCVRTSTAHISPRGYCGAACPQLAVDNPAASAEGAPERRLRERGSHSFEESGLGLRLQPPHPRGGKQEQGRAPPPPRRHHLRRPVQERLQRLFPQPCTAEQSTLFSGKHIHHPMPCTSHLHGIRGQRRKVAVSMCVLVIASPGR